MIITFFERLAPATPEDVAHAKSELMSVPEVMFGVTKHFRLTSSSRNLKLSAYVVFLHWFIVGAVLRKSCSAGIENCIGSSSTSIHPYETVVRIRLQDMRHVLIEYDRKHPYHYESDVRSTVHDKCFSVKYRFSRIGCIRLPWKSSRKFVLESASVPMSSVLIFVAQPISAWSTRSVWYAIHIVFVFTVFESLTCDRIQQDAPAPALSERSRGATIPEVAGTAGDIRASRVKTGTILTVLGERADWTDCFAEFTSKPSRLTRLTGMSDTQRIGIVVDKCAHLIWCFPNLGVLILSHCRIVLDAELPEGRTLQKFLSNYNIYEKNHATGTVSPFFVVRIC
jgi:hypothetical protein